MITSGWKYYISEDTGTGIGGKLSESLNAEHINPFLKLVEIVKGICRLHFVFDYYGTRYHLLLQQNKEIEECRENNLLSQIAKDLQEDVDYTAKTEKCLDLFWPLVAKDFLAREKKNEEKENISTRFQRKETIKIQLFTDKDGLLSRASHNERCLYPFSDPIINPCPTNVCVVEMEEIEFLEELSFNVFKAKIGTDLVCVKGSPAEDLRSEIEVLMRVSHHPNVISPLLGIVDAGHGRIDKFVIPFIKGKQLSHVKKATIEQKAAWKKQLSEAIDFLHDKGLTWGDGSEWNVMIEEESGKAVLIDFAFGYCKGLEGNEKGFVTHKANDLKTLAYLNDFIDNLTCVATLEH